MNRDTRALVGLLALGLACGPLGCKDTPRPSGEQPASTNTTSTAAQLAHGACDPSGGKALAALGPVGKAPIRYTIDGTDVTQAVFRKRQADLVEVQRGPSGYGPEELTHDVFHTCSKSTKKPFTYRVTTSKEHGPQRYDLVSAKVPPASPSPL